MAQFTLNLMQGSVTFNYTDTAALALKKEIEGLVARLKAKASSSGKPVPQAAMEYRYTGDVFLEVFCNPNIYPGPFAAKVLLTVRDERIRLTTEAELTRLIEDLDQFIEQNT
jgi:hypothetical protein